jgi:ATP-dependent DNA helicase RecG
VLVATVVIEVGVDVPEASVIVIEDAWRFGLAQLHQLRGRVGRSDDQSYCYLLGEAPSDDGVRRLEALVASNDGFALAEIDLDLRGEGTLLGARQRGRSDLRLASLRRDEDLLVRRATSRSMVRRRPRTPSPRWSTSCASSSTTTRPTISSSPKAVP